MEITLLIMEKSWNCVFGFLWFEPCFMLFLVSLDISSFDNGVDPDQQRLARPRYISSFVNPLYSDGFSHTY